MYAIVNSMGRILLAVLACLAAAPAAAQVPAQPAACDVVAQNLYVRDVMAELYFWYREIPAAGRHIESSG